jgi:hypothetical protein
MSADKKKLLSQLKGILAKTRPGCGCTAAEMQVAANMAQTLMTRHQVTLMEVEAAEGGDRFQRSEIDLDGCKTLTLWRMKLLAAVGAGCYVEPVYLRPGQYRDEGKIAFLGRPDNVEAAIYMYQALVNSVDAAANEAVPQDLNRGAKTTWARQFRTGAADTLARRIAERRAINERTLFTRSCEALVLRDRDELLKYREQLFGRDVRTFTAHQRRSHIAARNAGAQAAESIPLEGGLGLPGHKTEITD